LIRINVCNNINLHPKHDRLHIFTACFSLLCYWNMIIGYYNYRLFCYSD